MRKMASFVPGVLIDYLRENPSIPNTVLVAEMEATTLGIDIVGFTPLTESMSRNQVDGGEDVQLLLNDVFEPLLSVIEGRGGRIIHFAGDSITALWRGCTPDLVNQVAGCGLEAVDVTSTVLGRRGHRVEVRVGVGTGETLMLQLGGHSSRWHCLIAGPAMEAMGSALSSADIGDVVLAPDAVELAGGIAIDRAPGGFGVVAPEAEIKWLDPELLLPPVVPDEILETLGRFVSLELADRIVADPTHWLSEFRPLSTVFVNLPHLDVTDHRSRNALQVTFRKTQEILDQVEGSLVSVGADEKGVTLTLGFGLAPWAHEDDASRAVRAAQAIHNQLLDLQLTHGIGVATGRTFCGVIGTDVHREYTIISSHVNRSARLMQVARNEVLCDEATVAMTRGRVAFSGLEPVRVKGLSESIRTYRPSWETDEGIEAYKRLADTTPFVGRNKEREQLGRALDALVAHGAARVSLIEGEAGIGKSALAGELIHEAAARGIPAFVGAADPIEVNNPYSVWRGVFERMLGFDIVVDPQERQQLVRDQLSDDRLVSHASLLDALIPIGFPETAATAELTADGRRSFLSELLVRLLSQGTRDKPAVIVLEDAQWFDASSWALLELVEANALHALVVITSRNDAETASPDFLRARETADPHITLERVDGDDVVAMACQRLGVQDMPDSIASLIRLRGEGHPLFTVELASALVERGVVAVGDGTLRLAVDEDQLEHLDLPDSIAGLLMSRIDQLTPGGQMTLKVASVIGRSFDRETLAAVHPAQIDEAELADHLDALDKLDLMTTVGTTPTFAHVLIQDAAYRLTSRQLRTELHGRVAALMKDRGVAISDFTTMAHHLAAADDRIGALDYLEGAAAAAFETGAMEVAGRLYEQVIDLADTSELADQPISDQRRAQWLSQLGESDFESGRASQAKERHVHALQLLGFSVPRTAIGATVSLCWEILVQLAHLLLSRLEGRSRGDQQLRQAAAISAHLGKTYYYEVDVLRWALVELKSINLAERVGDPGVAGSGYAGLGTLVGILRAHRLAKRYFSRSRIREDGPIFAGLTGPIASKIETNYAPSHAIVAAMAEAVYRLQISRHDWQEAVPMLDQAITSADQLVDPASMGAARTIRAMCLHLQANIDDIEHAAHELTELGRRDTQHLPNGMALLIPLLVAGGKVDHAIAAGAELLELSDLDELMVPMVHAARALALASAEDYSAVLTEANLAVEHLGSSPIFIHRLAFTSLLDALELVVTNSADETAARQGAALAKRVRRRFRWFAVISPFARSASLYYRGVAAGRGGRQRRAKSLLQRGLNQAVRHGYSWDQARTLEALAALETTGSEKRQDLESQANRLNRQLGSHPAL